MNLVDHPIRTNADSHGFIVGKFLAFLRPRIARQQLNPF